MAGYQIQEYTENMDFKDYLVKDLNLDESKVTYYKTAKAVAFWYKGYLFVVDGEDMEIKCMGGDVIKQYYWSGKLAAVMYEDLMDDGKIVVEVKRKPEYGFLSGYEEKVKVVIHSNELETARCLGYCKNMENAYLSENTKNLNRWTFRNCENLKKIVLPETVTEIGDEAFMKCKNLKKINLPNGLTSLGSGAFNGCSSLEGIGKIPDGITVINGYVFAGCSKLNIMLTENITEIGVNAFMHINLDAFYIPRSVTNIGANAFSYASIKKVYYGGSQTEWDAIEGAGHGNIQMVGAVIYYFSETRPESSGNYWHYVNGSITEW